MKNIIISISLIIMLMVSCADVGADGISYLIVGVTTDSSNNPELDIALEFETNAGWDGEWDYILSTHNYDDVTQFPNHTISPGTYEYMVIITENNLEEYFCSTNYPCPDGGEVKNLSLVVLPNLPGADASSLFEDGEIGENMYYFLEVHHDGLVSMSSGTASLNF